MIGQRQWWGLVLVVTVCATGAHGQEFYPRGDADCTLRFTAADLVAVTRGFDASICGNDDCTRDGEVDADDVACTLSCLFDECATPLTAPMVTAVEPDFSVGIAPYTTVRVLGANFGADDRIKRVTIAGVDAPVIDFLPPDELVVLVPQVPPGPADIEVHDGDLVGFRTAIVIDPQIPIGEPDTLEDTFDLFDLVLGRFVQLDLASAFAEDALVIGTAIMSFRETLAEQRAALATDPAFTPQVRAALDAGLDSSGVPDMLRDILVIIEDLENASLAQGGATGPAGGPTLVVAAASIGSTLAVAGKALIAGGSAVLGTALSAPAAAVAVATGVVAGTVTFVVSGTNPPIISSVRFTNPGFPGEETSGPRVGSIVAVRGTRLDFTHLVVQTAGGSFSLEPIAADDDGRFRQFRLPGDSVGFCGRIAFTMQRNFPLVGTSNRIDEVLTPLIEAFIPAGDNMGVPREEKEFRAHAMSGCKGQVFFSGETDFGSAPTNWLTATSIKARIPQIQPGNYRVSGTVANYTGPALLTPLIVPTSINQVDVTCNPMQAAHRTTLDAPPGGQSLAFCTATTLPMGAMAPPHSYFKWQSSDTRTASLTEPGANGAAVTVRAHQPGSTTISASFLVDRQTIASSDASTSTVIIVEDNTAPTVTATSSSPGSVPAGSGITVNVRATDNVTMSRVRLVANGEPVSSGTAEMTCLLQRSCSHTFTVNLKTEFQSNAVTIFAEAFDTAGNKATSATLSFTVLPETDTVCPAVTIQSPPNGGGVNAGAQVQVVARATDAFGVKSFRYSATGDALVNSVSQDLPFPNPLMSADLRFTFTVKDAEALMNVTNRDIRISVEAFDEKGNTCGAQFANVSVLGILDNCEGSITTDNAVDFAGQPFTITVTLTGPTAAEITRVTSINPGGQFDLTARGNGVHQVTLFYQGTGRFVLRFTAFDAQGNDRCSGSIALESLGPEP